MKLLLLITSLVLIGGTASAGNGLTKEKPFTQPEDIRIYSKKPWYWEYKGKPVLLRGGTDDDNLFQWTGRELTDHLDLLASLGGNFVRNTMSDRDEGNVYAFKQISNGMYDLSQWNEAYWDRLKFFLDETSRRDIIVQLTLWDWFDHSTDNYKRHPLNPANNITWDKGVISGRDDYYGGSLKNKNEKVLELQRKYIDHLLSITFRYGHILYNMTNESELGEEWENYWAKYIRQKAQENNKRIFITSMNIEPSTGIRHVLTNRELYDYVEISQNNQDSRGGRGRQHYENIVKWRRIIELDQKGPMPMNNEKIYGSGDGRVYFAGTGKEAEDRFWKNVFGGAAAVRFHRPSFYSGVGYSGIGLNERAQVNIKAMNIFLEEFDLFSAGPYEGVKFVSQAEGYALANLGKEYAVYFPAGRYSLELDPWVFAKEVSVKFLDIDSGTWSEVEYIKLKWEEELAEFFGFQRGLSLTTPIWRPCVAVIRVIE